MILQTYPGWYDKKYLTCLTLGSRQHFLKVGFVGSVGSTPKIKCIQYKENYIACLLFFLIIHIEVRITHQIRTSI